MIKRTAIPQSFRLDTLHCTNLLLLCQARRQVPVSCNHLLVQMSEVCSAHVLHTVRRKRSKRRRWAVRWERRPIHLRRCLLHLAEIGKQNRIRLGNRKRSQETFGAFVIGRCARVNGSWGIESFAIKWSVCVASASRPPTWTTTGHQTAVGLTPTPTRTTTGHKTATRALDRDRTVC